MNSPIVRIRMVRMEDLPKLHQRMWLRHLGDDSFMANLSYTRRMLFKGEVQSGKL